MDAITKASMLTLYILLTVAVVSDLRSQRVSNRLILVGLAAAVLFRGMAGGFTNILAGILGILIPVILLFLFFVCGALGAGDIKLFSMIGGFVNLRRLLLCMSMSLLAGAVWSLVLLLLRRRMISSLYRVWLYASDLLRGKWTVYEQKDPKNRICFTAAILVGTIVSGFM